MWKPDLTARPGKPINPWSAVRFATVLCVTMLVGSVFPFLPSNPAVPAFYSFLPVPFLLITLWHKGADSRAAALEQRIRTLEARLAAKEQGAT